jgi:fibrillarin-like pre-rRNA processing protein
MRELVNNVCRYRKNVTPILEDARKPDEYVMFMEDVDSIYCDIAQPEQARVMADNADLFLKAKGWTMLSVKSQSIDVTKKPVEVYNQEANTLETRGFKIKDMVQLEPYVKAHAMIVSQAK